MVGPALHASYSVVVREWSNFSIGTQTLIGLALTLSVYSGSTKGQVLPLERTSILARAGGDILRTVTIESGRLQ